MAKGNHAHKKETKKPKSPNSKSSQKGANRKKEQIGHLVAIK
jgi:hypothetical protein